jgi:hypothetical protein
MQVNLMHHAGAFANLEDAFDPRINAAYAGRFLKGLFGALNDWGMAIAAYHSRTPGIGEPYRDMVVATWRPTDPDVLSRLTFQPLPPIMPSMGGMGLAFGPRRGPMVIPIGGNMSYRSFVQPVSAYQSFKSPSLVYADFTKRAYTVRNRPLDLRVAGGLSRGLIMPRAVIDRTSTKADKVLPPKRPRENG